MLHAFVWTITVFAVAANASCAGAFRFIMIQVALHLASGLQASGAFRLINDNRSTVPIVVFTLTPGKGEIDAWQLGMFCNHGCMPYHEGTCRWDLTSMGALSGSSRRGLCALYRAPATDYTLIRLRLYTEHTQMVAVAAQLCH